jgi:hypothetical protein
MNTKLTSTSKGWLLVAAVLCVTAGCTSSEEREPSATIRPDAKRPTQDCATAGEPHHAGCPAPATDTQGAALTGM